MCPKVVYEGGPTDRVAHVSAVACCRFDLDVLEFSPFWISASLVFLFKAKLSIFIRNPASAAAIGPVYVSRKPQSISAGNRGSR